MRRLKKGFTIIELVIVIAVIAVLTAVLVPTFVHLSKKARDTNDKSIVTSANIQLAAQEGLQGKNRSMSEAVKDVDEIGYHMSTVPTGNGNKIVWDSVSDRFVLLGKDNNVLLSDGEVSSHDKLFYAVSSISEAGDFAIYAKSNFEGTETEVSFTSPKSFDAGEKEGITKVSYDFTDVGSVFVATNSEGTELDVKAPNADFEHSDLCGKIIIKSVDDDTFRDYGHVGYVEINSGHYVADSGSNIKAVYATSENAKVDKQNGGQIENAYGGAASYTGDNSKGNVELDFSELENRDSIAEQALKDLDHDINPTQTRVVEVYESNDFVKVTSPQMFTRDGTTFAVKYTVAQDTIFNLHDTILIHGLVGIAPEVKCVINLNGYQFNVADLTLDPDGECAIDNIIAIYIGAGAELHMVDSVGTGGYMMNSYFDAPNMPNFYALFHNEGTLVIDGGTYYNKVVDFGIYVQWALNLEQGTIIIKSGTNTNTRTNNIIGTGTVIDERL